MCECALLGIDFINAIYLIFILLKLYLPSQLQEAVFGERAGLHLQPMTLRISLLSEPAMQTGKERNPGFNL